MNVLPSTKYVSPVGELLSFTGYCFHGIWLAHTESVSSFELIYSAIYHNTFEHEQAVVENYMS